MLKKTLFGYNFYLVTSDLQCFSFTAQFSPISAKGVKSRKIWQSCLKHVLSYSYGRSMRMSFQLVFCSLFLNSRILCLFCILLHLQFVPFAFCRICILSGLHFVYFWLFVTYAFCQICNLSLILTSTLMTVPAIVFSA